MDPKPTDEERLAQHVAERRLDEIAELLARAVLRIIARDEDVAPQTAPKRRRRRSPKDDSPSC